MDRASQETHTCLKTTKSTSMGIDTGIKKEKKMSMG